MARESRVLQGSDAGSELEESMSTSALLQQAQDLIEQLRITNAELRERLAKSEARVIRLGRMHTRRES